MFLPPVTFWHPACTPKRGQDLIYDVTSNVQVYGVEQLRNADASIMPTCPEATRAPRVVFCERTTEIIQAKHRT